MATLNLSLTQLIEAIRNLSEEDKHQIREVLNNDFTLSEAQLKELLQRKQDFLDGKIASKPWTEVRKRYERNI